MSIFKTSSGWRVQVDIGKLPDGKRDRKTASCKTKREAQKLDYEFNALKRSRQGHSNRLTLSAYIDNHFWPDKEEVLRKNTLAGYSRDIEIRIRPRFGKVLIAEITHSQIQKMLSDCPTKKTAQNARATLRCILAHAVDNQLLTINPAAGKFRMPESITKKDQYGEWVTSFAEHRDIIQQADDIETETILILGFCFGLRKGEVLGLDWQEVDMDKREIYIKQTYTYTLGAPDLDPPKTPDSARVIPMTDYAWDCIESLKKRDGITRITGPVALHNNKRMSPRRATDLIERFRKSHDVPHITMTTLRHSFATAAIRSGVNVASVAKWLGHTDVTTTLNRYVKPLLVDLKEDAKIIDAAYIKTA